jgi:predicted acetyltransferase
MGFDGGVSRAEPESETHLEIRTVEQHERHAAFDAKNAALLSHPIGAEAFGDGGGSWDDCDSLAAWDGGRCVGHLGAYRFDTTVPGGARVPMAGITRVGVLPTHTRRGLLRAMMERSLRDARRRGQILAGLRASEATIYGRFGFGVAGENVAVRVDARRARPLRTPRDAGKVRLLRSAEILDVVPAIYERSARRLVGTINRPVGSWERIMSAASTPGTEPRADGTFVAVHTGREGVDDGYVLYSVGWKSDLCRGGGGEGTITELWGRDAETERALWQYLLEIDLVTTWTADPRPVDEPIRRAFADSRAYAVVQRLDEQWVRLLDVDAAMAARRWGPAACGATVAVLDPLFEANEGCWSISADGAERTDRDAEIAVDIATISAAYLGGVSWRELVDAGELGAAMPTPELIERLDALFVVRSAPFSGTFF